MTRTSILPLALLAATSIHAKTLALWPIDLDYDNGETTVKCATDRALDLMPMKTLTLASGADTLPWNLPPNPDASSLLFTPYTYVSLMSDSGEGYLKAQLPPQMLVPNSVYTIEGYVKFTGTGNLGTGAAWVILVHVDGRLQLRMAADGSNYRLHIWAPNPTTGGTLDAHFTGKAFTADELRDGKWHHWAFTQLPNDGDGHRIYEAFWDGASVGTLTDGAITTTHSNTGVFMLGTRGQYGNTVKGGMEYVRISDCVLKPEEFLCAGGGPGTVITPPQTKTAAYWRLGRDANGGVVGLNLLGGAPLGRSFITSSNVKCAFTPVADCAFAGQPPNATAALATDNRGSFATGNGVNAAMSFPGLGTPLTADKDFTVETYYKPEHRAMDVTGSRAVFGTMPDFNQYGWTLMLCTNPKTSSNWGRRFRLIARDASGVLYNHTDIGASVPDWDDQWKHVALVHHAAGGAAGFGYWELFIDGVSFAKLTDSRQLGDSALTAFILGSQCSQHAALGKFDCLRVSGAALSPDQFLCAKDGAAAANVLAYFPLDVDAKGAAYSPFRDIVGAYTQGETDTAAAYKPAVSDDEPPAVTNPDVSAGSVPATGITGSLGFVGNGGGSNSQLYTADPAALDVINSSAREYTIEAYVKPDAPTAEGHIFLASVNTFDNSWPALNFRLSYKPSGFIVNDHIAQNDAFNNKEIGGKMIAGEWHHVALVFSVRESSECEYGVGNWKLYVDGKLEYDSDNDRVVYKLRVARTTVTGIEVGGRHWSSGSFQGKIASVRLSKAALAPSEFLCAPAPQPEAPVTASFWPLDYRGGVLDLADRVAANGAFVSAAAAGSTERPMYAPVHVSIPAESAGNRGSVVMAAGAFLSSEVAAEKIGNLTKPFTVEGYLKWGGAAARDRETVCGTYRNGHGWKLVLDATGDTPTFRIVGCGRMPTSAFVNAGFGNDASSLAAAWRHVALAYDPAGAGTWRLYVDGALVGAVTNAWNPLGIDIRQSDFLLGADPSDADASFVGGLDFWRISEGVRPVSEFLYPALPPPGMLLFIR